MANSTDVITALAANMEEKLLDIGAERAVLSGLLQYGIDVYVAISDIISVDSFVNPNNAIIFQKIFLQKFVLMEGRI